MLEPHLVSEYSPRICTVILISGCGHLSIEMPQENYTLTEFDWDSTLEKLREKIGYLVFGDLTDEEIGRTKGVLCAHIEVRGTKVSFNLSQYGKLQISNPNSELLRRAKSQLSKLVVCSRWVPREAKPVDIDHVMSIASGLKALCKSVGRYHMKGRVVPDLGYAKFAVQHLEAYPELYRMVPPEICRLYFPERKLVESREKIETLRTHFDIERVEGRLRESLTKKLEDRLKGEEIPIGQRGVSYVVNALIGWLLASDSLSHLGSMLRVEEIAWTEKRGEKWDVNSGDRVLCSVENVGEAEKMKNAVKESVMQLVDEEQASLKGQKDSYGKLAGLRREFCDELDLLVRRLIDMKELKGECDVCR